MRPGCPTPAIGRRGWALLLAALAAFPAAGFQIRKETGRLDRLTLVNPAETIPVQAVPVEALASASPLKAGWTGFRARYGDRWSVELDARSGAPLLAQGPALPLAAVLSIGSGTVPLITDALAEGLRAFLIQSPDLFLASEDELVLDRDASGPAGPDGWRIDFGREVSGVPVEGDRYVFLIGHGRLTAFGAPRWTPRGALPPEKPALGRGEAQAKLLAYVSVDPAAPVDWLDRGTLRIVPLPARGGTTGAYAGPVGEGYAAALAWRFEMRVPGEPGRWGALVDARSGSVIAFEDLDLYSRVQGGVFPASNDRICPDGCEQGDYPMPYADLVFDGTSAVAGPLGQFLCPAGSTGAATTLTGPYVAVSDTCGELSAGAPCGSDLDLGASPASGSTDCAVPPGMSTGDTHAARTGFYHLNRIIEKARTYLPSNPWLSSRLTDNVNLPSTCNAFWDGGSVNFYRSGGGCRNTGEIAGVFLHEWGHGLDENDGGGFDNPSEAYGDITAMLQTRSSCIGRGFFQSHTCGGYGDPCLTCTGIRDIDWNRRLDHVPSTPWGFLPSYCQSGSGPCGKEVHCEGYIAGETLFDLATRDLPASGLDAASAWQIAESLWYRSRPGSGGRAYNCALPASDGCLVTSWFTSLRAADDDDGDLSNGTPHAGAIFAAFDRHGIACGGASDPANLEHTICPPLTAPDFIATAGSESASLAWAAVPGAALYRVFRSDLGCASGASRIVETPGTVYTDTDLADGFAQFYFVQPVGENPSCEGAVSACRSVTPQPYAGSVALDRALYGCAGLLQVSVRDGNVEGESVSVTVSSASEPAGETLVLARTAPGSSLFQGTIAGTPAPTAQDGRLSLTDGDAIHVQYTDADDGQGHAGFIRQTGAGADCVAPLASNVRLEGVGGRTATIAWETNESASGVVRYGRGAPGGSEFGSAAVVTSHHIALSGLEECADYLYAVVSTDPQGNASVDDNQGAGYPLHTARETHPTFASAGPRIPIPDNDPGGASSAIVVSDEKPVLDVNVQVNLTHTWDADLVVALVTPTGRSITLANRRGRAGHGFLGTVFDDEAPTPIGEGSPPYAGTFAPDRPLTAADGIGAAGTWTLKVVDADVNDTGTIDAWALQLSYPDADCGPHAAFADQTQGLDWCAAGGSGTKNHVADSGERIEFGVGIANDGTAPLTGVTVRVVSLTPGVTMIRDSAPYAPIAPGGTGRGAAEPFAAQLSPGLACGTQLRFAAEVGSDQGGWEAEFSRTLGSPVTGQVTELSESFTHGVPASWSVVNGGSGGGAAATWTTANPGARTFIPPLAAPVAMVDSDRAGTSAVQDEQLLTPVMDLRGASSVIVDYDEYFQWYDAGHDEKGDLDVRSSRTGGAWVNVDRNQGGSSFNPEHRRVDISPQAAGASGVQLRFHYYDASFEWWWELDNVVVTTSRVIACGMTPCVASLGPPPVPDGNTGAPMTAARAGTSGSAIDVHWDASSCPAQGYHLLFGAIAGLPSMTPLGGVCSLGPQGIATWNGVPPGNLWFVVVSDDEQGREGSWGLDSSGAHRGGTSPSEQCGFTVRDNSGECNSPAGP